MVDGTPSVKQVPRTGGKLGFRGDVAAKPGVDRSTGQDVVFEFPIQEYIIIQVIYCRMRRNRREVEIRT